MAAAGRVVDGVGRALVSAKVRLVGRDRELDELIEAAVTDERGEFSAVYHMKDLAPDGTLPHLAIVVEDAARTLPNPARASAASTDPRHRSSIRV